MAANGASMEVDSEQLSPRQQKSASMQQAIESLGSMNNGFESIGGRADPDAQATVTDFLEFTEYLPSDMTRSLTLIKKLDQAYIDASTNVHNLTRAWGQLPTLAPEARPQPVQLRADISENLNQALSSRVYAHAEAVRMAENVNRHYNRIKTIRAKLQTMLENFPAIHEEKSPVATAKSPQATRATKVLPRQPGGGEKGRRPRVPRICVPGDILAPHEVAFEMFSDDSADSDSNAEEDGPARQTPGPRAGIQQRGKIIKIPKIPKPKVPKHPPAVPLPSAANPPPGAPNSTIVLRPPPPDAVLGSADAPWFQLTPWELARLRKRMKKNSAWVPSETMITRELKSLGRGWDPYLAAKSKAEDEGKPFEVVLHVPGVDGTAGTEQLPMGAVSFDAAKAAEGNYTNRGMELNKAKKLKKEESLAQRAAEEAEEGARQMRDLATTFMQSMAPVARTPDQSAVKATKSRQKKEQKKRKRDSAAEAEAEKPESVEGSSQRPPVKRSKTETPVPVPQQHGSSTLVHRETPVPPPRLTPGSSTVPQSTTPVPVPVSGGQDPSILAVVKSSESAASSVNGSALGAATLPVEAETITAPVSEPVTARSPKESTTPNIPSVRETRQREAKKEHLKENPAPIRTSNSRGATPAVITPAADSSRRPSSSRGAKATSQEPQPSLAADRPRRTSTARNTPAPEPRQTGKRTKRPAPGIVTRTNAGGSSAVTKRKAAPKKKRGIAPKKGRGQTAEEVEVEAEVEVDDEGNVIKADEPLYCLCNRVSFGTMIQCENFDNCKYEWFHLECVGMTAAPATTTKWYCPECRVVLNIGEKGEISARGVRK